MAPRELLDAARTRKREEQKARARKHSATVACKIRCLPMKARVVIYTSPGIQAMLRERKGKKKGCKFY